MADPSSESIVIAAAPSAIMDVVADFDCYPEWTGSIREARVVDAGSDGRARRVAFTVDAGVVKDKYVLDYVWDGDTAVSWSLVEGEMQRSQQGSYALAATGRGTEVTYTLSIELAVPMIGMLRRKIERVIMETALKGLKKRVESGV